ncbi:MAG: hypothetical protein AAF978_01305 [Cyanobacteria bacterium P01_E01_bin.48]
MPPEDLDRWFAPALQQEWVNNLIGAGGLTRRRAECFVRLCAYLMLKQQSEPTSLTTLNPSSTWVSCTHGEAAALFYADGDRGSERAAGMMLDKLEALGLLSKRFDGNTTGLKILRVPQLPSSQTLPGAVPDAFAPRTDAVLVANLLAANYNWLNKNSSAAPLRIARLLRAWAAQYAVGMRVLRRTDTQAPVGFYLLYPTASESEACFFAPPNRSLHLSSGSDVDPIVMAQPGDVDCVALFVRSFVVTSEFAQYRTAFLKDSQQAIARLQVDFPNLCDMHTIVIHPSYEALAQALGFQKSFGCDRDPLAWMYTPLDRFLALNMECVLAQTEV